LVDTNFKVWQPRYESKEALLKQLELFTDSLQHEQTNEEALLTEICLKAGKPLTSKPNIIHSGPNVYQIDASLCLAIGPLSSEALGLITEAKPKELLVLGRDYNTPSGDAALSNIRLELREAGIALSIL